MTSLLDRTGREAQANPINNHHSSTSSQHNPPHTKRTPGGVTIPSSASTSSIDSAATLLDHHHQVIHSRLDQKGDSDVSDNEQQGDYDELDEDSRAPLIPSSSTSLSSSFGGTMVSTPSDMTLSDATTSPEASGNGIIHQGTSDLDATKKQMHDKRQSYSGSLSACGTFADSTVTSAIRSSTTTTTPIQARSSSSRTFLTPLTPLSKPISFSTPPSPHATTPSLNHGDGSGGLRRSSSSSAALSKLGFTHSSNGSFNHLHTSNTPPTTATSNTSAAASSIAMNSLAKKRRLNLLRVRIERGLVVSMALLAAYRIMTLQESTLLDILNINATSSVPGVSGIYSWQQQQPDGASLAPSLVDSGKVLVKNAFALGAALVLLVAIHALVLQTHDHRLEFSLHNKIMPLQPITKRSSRLFKDADDDEDDDDDSDDARMTKEEWMEQEVLAQSQSGHYQPPFHNSHSQYHGTSGGDWMQARPPSWKTRSLNWRVFGTEPHWYRKGADNGSIFATILVPVALVSKFYHVIQEHSLSGTSLSLGDFKTLEALLCSLSLSLTFGFSILVHMGLLKLFEDHRDLWSPRLKESAVFAENATLLDSLYLMPEAVAQATSTGAQFGNGSSSSLYPRQTYHHHPEASMGPSPAPSTTISASATPSTRSANSSPVLSAARFARPASHSLQSSTWSSMDRTHSHDDSQHDNMAISSDQMMIHPSLLIGSSETEAQNEREEKWILALGVGGAYTFGLMLLTRFRWLPGLERTSAGMVMLTQSIFQLLMLFSAHFFKRSFTFGEMTVLSQAVTLMVHETLIMYFGHDALVTRSMDSKRTNHSTLELMPGSFHTPEYLLMLTLIVGMMMIGLLMSPLLVYCRRLAQLPRKGQTSINVRRRGLKKRIAAVGVYLGILVAVIGVIMPQTSKVLGQNPFQWLIDFMLMTKVDWGGMGAQLNWWANKLLFGPNSTAALAAAESLTSPGFSLSDFILSISWRRVMLCMYWITAIVASILFLEWMKTSARRRAIMGSLNNRRKFYHALAVMMFTPGFLLDKPFMHLAFSVAVASMILLEYIRYFAVYPIGKEIHLFMVGFLDDRDRGPIILSHLYLLIGCAVPVWLAGQDVLAGLSGIFALGFGDAMASIVGRRWGRHRWPGTIKTVEGTAAFVASILVAAGVIQVLLWLFAQDQTLSPVLDSLFNMQVPASLVKSAEGGSGDDTAVLMVLWIMVRGAIGAIARYGLAVSGAAMLEAVSEQNDNLVIPVAMLAVVWLL